MKLFLFYASECICVYMCVVFIECTFKLSSLLLFSYAVLMTLNWKDKMKWKKFTEKQWRKKEWKKWNTYFANENEWNNEKTYNVLILLGILPHFFISLQLFHFSLCLFGCYICYSIQCIHFILPLNIIKYEHWTVSDLSLSLLPPSTPSSPLPFLHPFIWLFRVFA